MIPTILGRRTAAGLSPWLALGCLTALVAAAGPTRADEAGTTKPVAESVAKRALATPDPLKGTEKMDPATTGPDAEAVLARLLPPRSDSPSDWYAPLEPLHYCGEPRLLPTCVPPPPCHPSQPPNPYDLVGVRGGPTCGPIYRGPCAPRTGSRDAEPHPHVHRVHDRVFDWFYNPRTPILP
jgi:hypothetical protein